MCAFMCSQLAAMYACSMHIAHFVLHCESQQYLTVLDGNVQAMEPALAIMQQKPFATDNASVNLLPMGGGNGVLLALSETLQAAYLVDAESLATIKQVRCMLRFFSVDCKAIDLSHTVLCGCSPVYNPLVIAMSGLHWIENRAMNC